MTLSNYRAASTLLSLPLIVGVAVAEQSSLGAASATAAVAAQSAPAQAAPTSPANRPAEVSELPPLPKMPAAITQLVLAQPFVLQEPFVSEYRAGGEIVTRGWLLVVQAPLPLLVPRQTLEPVVQVGQSLPIRVNHGNTSGYAVLIAPAAKDQLLANTRILFGPSGLPERMDDAAIDAALTRAAEAGITPIGEPAANQAISRGEQWLKSIARVAPAEALTVKDRTALVELANGLVAIWAPAEVPEPAVQ